MGFLFCITRTNLIRGAGIQSRVCPPNAIWCPNKGLGERKQRITDVFQGLQRELLEECLLTNEYNFIIWPQKQK